MGMNIFGKSSRSASTGTRGQRVALGGRFEKNDAPVTEALSWSTSADAKTLQVDANGSGPVTVRKSGSDDQCYLVLNGSLKDFKALDAANGIAAPHEGGMIADFQGTASEGLQVSLKVIEFDEAGTRLAMQTVTFGKTGARLSFAPKTRRLLFAIRLAGQGSLTIEALLVRLFDTGLMPQPKVAQSGQKAQPKHAKKDHAPSTPVPGFAGSPMMTATQNAAGILNGAFGSIVSLVENLEKNRADPADLKKWRRRALGWEERYVNAFTDAPKPMATFSKSLLERLAATLPQSHDVRHFKPLPLRLGIVTDIYMFNYYKDCCDDVVYLSPDNWEDELARKPLDAFLYVTCWKGLENDEWRGVKFREKPQKALAGILAHCQENDIPSIFQSIEDPSNYEYFLPVAQKFDHVFTSDTDMIDRYREDCATTSVHYGEYGANTLLNNPVGCRRITLDSFFFAGSYPTRYPERCADMEVMFDSILGTDGDLVIADRNFGNDDDSLSFPQRFRNRIIPPLGHAVLQPIHKLFRFNLNFNSIKASPTMCAMRIYELQAQGRTIYSNYAHSVFNKFHNVRLLAHPDRLGALTRMPERIEEYRADMAAVRDIMTDRTSFEVVGRMMHAVGLHDGTAKKATVAVLVKGADSDAATRMVANQNYPDVVIVEDAVLADSDAFARFRDEHSVAYLAVLDPVHEYEDHYLQDLVNAFKYTNSRYVVCDDIFGYARGDGLPNHEFVTVAPDPARTMFAVEAVDLADVTASDTGRVLEGGYCIDPFGMNYDRYLQTLKADQAALDPVLSVVVPTYNNGDFLESKCFASLQRNALFDRMEILLVDDGSTDGKTGELVERLARNYGNVRAHRYEAGGSGSASRARNKGIEMASAPLVSFLDPDNEISIGGYDRLVALFTEAADNEEGAVDFVSGYQVKITETTKLTGNHASKGNVRIENLREQFFDRGRFPVVSTQAAVIDRRLFDDPDFRFVERAAGQDTLFGWELLARSRAGLFTNEAHLLYYAGRDGSVTNSLDVAYFSKMHIMEEAQVAALKNHGLFETYREKHFEPFLNGWYLEKLKQVPEEQVDKARDTLREIIRLYEFEADAFDF